MAVTSQTVEERVARDYPFLRAVHYLDSASVCPPPRPALEAMAAYYETGPANDGVGLLRAAVRARELVDAAREGVARFIGASAREVVFTRNTTEAINLVSRGIRWHPGDTVVLTTLEHQSNLIPWLREARAHHLRVLYLHARQDGRVDPGDLEALMAGQAVRLVAVTHVSNVLGTMQPVRELAAVARRKGALCLVDAAQSAGRIPVDVSEIGCDLAVFCGRKALMGPQGTGFLYGRQEVLATLEPLATGSRAGSVTGETTYREYEAPHRFEAGVLNTAGVIGLGRSVEYLRSLDLAQIESRVRRLTEYLLEGVQKVDGVVAHGGGDLRWQAGIVSLSVGGLVPARVGTWLDEQVNVAVATGDQGSPLVIRTVAPGGVVRVSVHWFTTEADLDALFEGLRQAVVSAR